MPAGPLQRLTWLLPAATAATLSAAALVWSNPGPAEFEAFAGDQLVGLLSGEVCRATGLPLALHLLVRDCPQLIRSQRGLLGRLAAQATQRINAGLFSIYVTELGGQALLPELHLPRIRAVTLAGAGQLTVLQASSDSGLQAH